MLNFSSWYNYKNLFSYVNVLSTFIETSISDEVIEYIIDSPKFINWLKSFGITDRLEKLASGSVGVAYQANEYVVKFTTDKKEADAAAVLKDYDSPNLAKIYDVKLISTSKDTDGLFNQNIYAIIQEKLNTDVSKRHRMAGQAIYDYMDNNPGFLPQFLMPIIPKVVDYLPTRWRTDYQTIRIIQEMLNRIQSIQNNSGVLTQDTHGANLALKGREPAFFDLGRSKIDFTHPRTANVFVKKL